MWFAPAISDSLSLDGFKLTAFPALAAELAAFSSAENRKMAM
jgi:hypothetical protein